MRITLANKKDNNHDKTWAVCMVLQNLLYFAPKLVSLAYRQTSNISCTDAAPTMYIWVINNLVAY